jgi:hypothetical protein
MANRYWHCVLITTLLGATGLSCAALACCPAPPSGKPVVNADQTVLIIWDAAAKTQHFIRQASFLSEADDFGFIVPSPTQPELSESSNEASTLLRKLTEPERQKLPRPKSTGCGCASLPGDSAPSAVRVLEERLVAGFHAVVLEADTDDALVKWLKENGYAFSADVQAWAKPYVTAGWKFTALKVAKRDGSRADKSVAAPALRITFRTDRPLFPYREPDPKTFAAALGANHRLLRIYFVAEGRYQGVLGTEGAWSAKAAWANNLAVTDREKLLELLNLPKDAGPAEWFLTEFEHVWPYAVAPADVYFTRAADQNPIKRPPIIEYVGLPLPMDAMTYAIAAVVVMPPLIRRVRRKNKPSPSI